MESSIQNTSPGFDPQLVYDLIRKEIARGRQPASLVLGQRETAGYHELLRYPHEASMRADYFHGLQVVEDSAATKMALAGDKGAWEG